MIAKRLGIFDFRNVESQVIDFCDGVNVLVGNNAEGKTNALEAICIFAQGKSFRAKSERELIRFGQNMGGIKLCMQSELKQYEDMLEVEYRYDEKKSAVKRRTSHNGVNHKKIGELLGVFRAVLFCPEHLMIVKGGPGERRAFMDVALSQLRPVYLAALQRYHAILAERNKLIKDAKDDRRTFDATGELWAYHLATESATVTHMRAKYIKQLGELTRENFAKMTSGREVPNLVYRPSAGAEAAEMSVEELFDRYFKLYTENADREIAAGATLWGAHKDDVMIYLDERDAKLYASQGQDRSIALAMKLSEGDISRQVTGESPVYLFDDVLSELDEGRRDFLLDNFTDRQIIITSCETRYFSGRDAKMIRVEGGRYYG